MEEELPTCKGLLLKSYFHDASWERPGISIRMVASRVDSSRVRTLTLGVLINIF